MIIRVWTALASDEDQHKYFEHFQSEVLPVLQGLAGYDGATLSSRRSEEGHRTACHYTMALAGRFAGFRRARHRAGCRGRRSGAHSQDLGSPG